MFFFIFVYCFLSSIYIKGIPVSEKSRPASFTIEALTTDIDYLVDKLEEVHADPYRVITRQDFKKRVANLKHQIKSLPTERLSLIECFYYLLALVATIQDEHTSLFWPWESFPRSDIFFPFIIRFIDGKMIVIKSLGKTEIPRASEIVEINKKPAHSIWKDALKYMNFPLFHAKVNRLERHINAMLSTRFNMVSPWIVRYKSGKNLHTVKADGCSRDILAREFSGSSAYQEHSIKMRKEEIPILDIPNFSYGNFHDYQKFIDDFFFRHRNKKHLVIDLRRNPGGNGTWGYYMLDYLTSKPYRIMDSFDFKVSQVFKNSFYRSKAGKNLSGSKDGDYIPIAENKIRIPHQNGNKFKGRVFLLISHFTNSAGVVASAIFKYHHMGTVIGQETAGRIKFNSDPVPVQLPETGLGVFIPVAIYKLPGSQGDRGVIPDIITVYTIDDLKKQIDKEMEIVKKLVSNQ